MLSNNKFLGKCWYGRHPWIRLAMESESMDEKGKTLFSVWEPPMIYPWKVLGTLSHFRWWDGYTSQNVFISKFFALSFGTSTNPYFPLRRAFLLLYAKKFIWVSIFSYKAPTKGHYDRTWVLGVANMRVCFMNGSMIEHDGLGITYFSVDILKDMVACWYAWVFKLSCKNKTIALNNMKVQMSML